MSSTTYALDNRILHVKIDGRVTPESIEGFRLALVEALATDGPFAVCFDRSSMTAVTKDGRAALQRWAAEYLPRLAGRCAGWADVYDARRAASLAKAAAARNHEPDPDPDHAPPRYPQQTFADKAEAGAWLWACLDQSDVGSRP